MASAKTTVGPATSRTSREHDSWCRAAEQQERREKREGAGLGIVDVEAGRFSGRFRPWEPVLPVCFAQAAQDLMWVRRRRLRATAYRAKACKLCAKYSETQKILRERPFAAARRCERAGPGVRVFRSRRRQFTLCIGSRIPSRSAQRELLLRERQT